MTATYVKACTRIKVVAQWNLKMRELITGVQICFITLTLLEIWEVSSLSLSILKVHPTMLNTNHQEQNSQIQKSTIWNISHSRWLAKGFLKYNIMGFYWCIHFQKLKQCKINHISISNNGFRSLYLLAPYLTLYIKAKLHINLTIQEINQTCNSKS